MAPRQGRRGRHEKHLGTRRLCALGHLGLGRFFDLTDGALPPPRIHPLRRQHRLRSDDIHAVVEPKNYQPQHQQKEQLTPSTPTLATAALHPTHQQSDRRRHDKTHQRSPEDHHPHDRQGAQQPIIDQLGLVAHQLDAEIEQQQTAREHVVIADDNLIFHDVS